MLYCACLLSVWRGWPPFAATGAPRSSRAPWCQMPARSRHGMPHASSAPRRRRAACLSGRIRRTAPPFRRALVVSPAEMGARHGQGSPFACPLLHHVSESACARVTLCVCLLRTSSLLRKPAGSTSPCHSKARMPRRRAALGTSVALGSQAFRSDQARLHPRAPSEPRANGLGAGACPAPSRPGNELKGSWQTLPCAPARPWTPARRSSVRPPRRNRP